MSTERVHFRLIQMPCCGHLFCNVNPRMPSFCPMCGTGVYPQVKSCVLFSDDKAMLKYNDGDGVTRGRVVGPPLPAGESYGGQQLKRGSSVLTRKD